MRSFFLFLLFLNVIVSNIFSTENLKDILFIGTGYVGLVNGACFAEKGNRVICLDIDEEKINNLNSNITPIYEPGLEKLIEKNKKENRLKFTTSYKDAIKNSSIIFICAPTPSNKDGSCNISFVKQIAEAIGKYIDDYKIIITKSTVPVGTTQKIKKIIKKEIAKRGKKISFDVASNSEFLKEGSAVTDCLYPDRVIIGAEKEKVKNELIELHKDFTDKIITMDISSAELTKYAANAMLACRISFMNQIANICKNVGANVNDVKRGLREDKRIGKLFLDAGVGYGGSCFPKDVKSLAHIAKKARVEPTLIEAIDKINNYQKVLLAKYIKNYFSKYQNLKGKTLSIWGLSFKPNTDDMREAPSLVMIDYLLKKGATLKLYDPIAMSNAKKLINNTQNIHWCDTALEAAKNSDGIVLLTEWEDFKKINLSEVKKLMNTHNIFDGRDFFDPKKVKKEGFNYVGIGIADEFITKPIVLKPDKPKENLSFFQRNWIYLNSFAIIAIILAILTKIYHLNLIKKLKKRYLSSIDS